LGVGPGAQQQSARKATAACLHAGCQREGRHPRLVCLVHVASLNAEKRNGKEK
jgi:hypothetical protein